MVLMKPLIITSLGLFLLIGCKKSNDTSTVQPVVPNDILYTPLNPNVFIGYDSSSQKTLWDVDINHDSINDFAFYPFYFYLDPDTVHPIGRLFYIHSYGSNTIYGGNFKFLNKDDTISNNCTWRPDFELYEPHAPDQCPSDTCKYLGLKIIKNTDYYFGWIELDFDLKNLVVRVRSYAVQQKPGISIKAGQIN